MPMRPLQVGLLVSAQLVCQFAQAQAQVLEPRRPSRPVASIVDSSRTQRLIVGLDLLGGYDDNLAPASGDGAPDFSARPSGYVGLSIARVDYRGGNNERFIELDGRSYMNTYRNIGVTPSYGGDIALRAKTPLGRRSEMEFRQALSYDPYFSLGAFNALPAEPGSVLPDANPTTGIGEIRSRLSDTRVMFSHSSTPRTRFEATYGLNDRSYNAPSGFDSRTHSAGLAYDQSMSRSTGLRVSYRHSNVSTLDLLNRPRPYQDHNLEFGARYGRDLSRTRRIEFGAGIGVTHVDTIRDLTRETLVYQAPSGYANGQFDLGRSWAVQGNYWRGVTMIQGVTPHPFVGDAASINVGGFVAPATDALLTATSSNGESLGGQDAQVGEFRTYAITGQLRTAISQRWSVLVSYTRYEYTMDRAASIVLGVQPATDRNAVRVGLSMTVPVLGGR